jgi:hypothetical protein
MRHFVAGRRRRLKTTNKTAMCTMNGMLKWRHARAQKAIPAYPL